MADSQQTTSDAARVRLPPPVVFLITTLLALPLHYGVRAWAWSLPATVRWGGGAALLLAGVVLMVSAANIFKRTGQDPKPWKPTPEIVRDGPYRFTRNPMYVAATSMQVGLGLLAGIVWMSGLAPISLAIVYLTAVRHEEVYLADKFGEDYLSYKRSVRRWL